jgi:NAD(P)-dependent dehydrogenase (short-subunit alcohol dehydrogenase family)
MRIGCKGIALLSGKNAVVTGAAGTIGTAVCLAFAACGARVAAVDRAGCDFASLAPIAKDQLLCLHADVTDEGDVKAYVAAVLRHFGDGIDIALNNAGIEGPVAPVTDYALADFRRVMAVNVDGVFLGMKHVLPGMLARRTGSIINMASVAGLGASPNVVGYIASKHAVVGLTRAAAVEAGPYGVRVNCLCPGPIRSPMIDALNRQRGETEETRAVRIPARRYGTAAEVAAMAAFLASDAAAYINGAALPVDGGLGATV